MVVHMNNTSTRPGMDEFLEHCPLFYFHLLLYYILNQEPTVLVPSEIVGQYRVLLSFVAAFNSSDDMSGKFNFFPIIISLFTLSPFPSLLSPSPFCFMSVPGTNDVGSC